MLNDLVNLIAVQILDTLSSLINEGEDRRQDQTYYVLSQKYSFVKKMETRICKVLPVSPSKQLDRRMWGWLTRSYSRKQKQDRVQTGDQALSTHWCPAVGGLWMILFTLEGKIYYNQKL